MNRFKFLVTAFLSIVLGAGVATGVAANDKHVDSVEAATTTRLYLDMTSFSNWYSSSASFKVHTWNSAKGDQYFKATKVSNEYWYCDVDLATYANGGGYRFTRYNSTGSSEWNRGIWCTYSSTNISNYCKVTNWNETGSWSNPTKNTWNITGGNSADDWATKNFNVAMTNLVFNASGLQWSAENVYLEAGTSFKVQDGANWLGFDCFETGTGSAITAKELTGTGTSNVEVKSTGYYDFYLKILTSKIWVQENSEQSAISWATSFLSTLVCDASGKTAPSSTEWTNLSTSYGNLTIGAKDFFINGVANKDSSSEIEQALARYEFVLSKYGTASYKDFIGRKTASKLNNALQLVVNNNSVNIILVITVLAAASISIILVIRKRKQTSK